MQKTTILLALTCTAFLSSSAQVPPPRVRAISTVTFLNSIGVNSAISRRGEQIEKTIAAIKYTGIRWIRTGYEGNAPMADYLRLQKETGVKFSFGLMSGGADIERLLKGGRELAAAGALLAFEGVNEPNNWPVTYKGEKGGKNLSWQPVAHLQADLYAAVKLDANLRKYPVWSISESGAQTDDVGLQKLRYLNTSSGEGIQLADAANVHNYFSHPSHPGLYDNQTWNAASPGKDCKVDGLFGNYGTTWLKKFRGYTEDELSTLAKVTTETGVTIGGEFSEEKQARLYLNLYLAQFVRGYSHTAVYLLRDRSDEAGNQSFGFYTRDYKPRKAAIYLHNLTTILLDSGAGARQPAGLAYQIIKQPETVHHLLLQNSNGKFQLVVWDERARGVDSITLQFDRKFKSLQVYDPTLGSQAIKTLKRTSELDLVLSDHPVVLMIEN